jgi:hypothetical protein
MTGEQQGEDPKLLASAIGPAASEFGREIAPAGAELGRFGARAVTALLAPAHGMVWCVERIRDWINKEVGKRLESVPEGDRQVPDPRIAGPAIDAMKYTAETPKLADMFAELLVSSMDRSRSHLTHPSFVEILKQMTPDEAKILEFLSTNDQYPGLELRVKTGEAGWKPSHRFWSLIPTKVNLQYPAKIVSCLDNLERLKLILIPDGHRIADDAEYDSLLNRKEILDRKKKEESQGNTLQTVYRLVMLTSFGREFIAVCIQGRSPDQPPTAA